MFLGSFPASGQERSGKLGKTELRGNGARRGELIVAALAARKEDL